MVETKKITLDGVEIEVGYDRHNDYFWHEVNQPTFISKMHDHVHCYDIMDVTGTDTFHGDYIAVFDRGVNVIGEFSDVMDEYGYTIEYISAQKSHGGLNYPNHDAWVEIYFTKVDS